MGIRGKFVKEIAGFSLKHIKKIDVEFNPFHPNAANIREFYQGITDRKAIRSNRECVLKAKVVSDDSNPVIRVKFDDDHNLTIDGGLLESSHLLRLVSQIKEEHKDEESL